MLAKLQGMALLCGAFCMAAAPLLLDAASTPTLNHYSDYGVVEQNSSANNGKLSIGNDPFGYSDEYTDNESGLQYLQVRYYDPAIMRFTAMDTYPLLNRYAYANENPIMNDDPTGHSAVGAGSSSSGGTAGVAPGDGTIIGIGLGALIGITMGFFTAGLSAGLSLYGALGLDMFSGAVSGAGGQEAQNAVEHQKANGLQLGIAAAMGAAIAAATFGAGRFISTPTPIKPAASDVIPVLKDDNISQYIDLKEKPSLDSVHANTSYTIPKGGRYAQDIFVPKGSEYYADTRIPFFQGVEARSFNDVDPNLTDEDVKTLETLRYYAWQIQKKALVNVTGATDMTTEDIQTEIETIQAYRNDVTFKQKLIEYLENNGENLTKPGKALYLGYRGW